MRRAIPLFVAVALYLTAARPPRHTHGRTASWWCRMITRGVIRLHGTPALSALSRLVGCAAVVAAGRLGEHRS
jgi:hypothetical protein